MLTFSVTNIGHIKNDILIWHRINKKLCLFKEKTYKNYYFEEDPCGTFRSYNGVKLKKVEVNDPYMARKVRTSATWANDIDYCKKYLYDNVNVTPCPIRWIMTDIETAGGLDAIKAEKEVTAITAYDNFDDEYKSFYLDEYASEFELIYAWIDWVKAKQADIICFWNGNQYDWQYLSHRMPNLAEALSPVGQYIKTQEFDIPMGISIVDYMLLFKRVYKFKKYAQEFVYCQTFNKPYIREKYDFSGLNENVKLKNAEDVRKLVEIEQHYKLLDYYNEIRVRAKADWKDLLYNSRIIDGIFNQTAKDLRIVLPNKPEYEDKLINHEDNQEDSIKGGNVFAIPGLHKDLVSLDISGAYPSSIITFNLDPSNKRFEKDTNCIEIHKTFVKQNSNAIVPLTASKLIAQRQEIKEAIKTALEKDLPSLKQKEQAIKSLVNSVYGVLCLRVGRLYDKDIAACITYLVRFLIRYSRLRLKSFGICPVLSDTDSIFVTTEEEKEVIESILKTIVDEWLHYFELDRGVLRFNYDRKYERLLVLCKKRYLGLYLDNEGKEKIITKGVDTVRSDASKFIEEFQTNLYHKALHDINEDEVVKWILSEVERFKTLDILDIGFPCKLQKDYVKSTPIFLRALRNTQEEINFPIGLGDYYYYIKVIPKRTKEIMKLRTVKGVKVEKKEIEKIDVLAFDEIYKDHIGEIDYPAMIERSIYKKCEPLFKAMKWDIKKINPNYKEPKKRIKCEENDED